MYFWNTISLAEKIRESRLTEGNEKNYYIGLALVGILYSLSGGAESSTSLDFFWVAKWLLMAVASLIGFNVVFRANGGADGARYLSKIIPLSFPISLKLYVLGFVFGFLSAIIADVAGWPLPTNDRYFMVVFSLFIEFLFFWRLTVHIRTCRSTTA